MGALRYLQLSEDAKTISFTRQQLQALYQRLESLAGDQKIHRLTMEEHLVVPFDGAWLSQYRERIAFRHDAHAIPESGAIHERFRQS
jgi:hypothetical protein